MVVVVFVVVVDLVNPVQLLPVEVCCHYLV